MLMVTGRLAIVLVRSRLKNWLLSAPSIIIGLFIYGAIVVPMGGFSAFAGCLALAVIVIPVVVRTTEDMLGLVPNPLREAASALGMPRSLVIRRIAYRAARAGLILLGLLLFVLTFFVLAAARLMLMRLEKKAGN